MDKKNIVVLGAGFGGLTAAMNAAQALREAQLLEAYQVILIDRNDCHLYTPLLYKLISASEAGYEKKCTYSINWIVRNLPIRFVQGDITAIDLAQGEVRIATGEAIHADYLVLALGSETNYFGIPGLQEFSLQWKTLESALRVRNELQQAFKRKGPVHIVIGGAGPNGVEIAAGIRTWADQAQEENRELKVSVSLLEGLPTIFPGLDPRAAAFGVNRLKKLNIGIQTNAKIVSVAKNEISITSGTDPTAPVEKIPFDLFIWTGGVKTSNLVIELPLAKEAHGKPLAQTDMTCKPGTPDAKMACVVYGLGDNIFFLNRKTGKPVPAVARAAILEAKIVAHNLMEHIKKAEAPASSSYHPSFRTYKPSPMPFVIPIGENYGVAKIGPIVFSGWLAELFEKLIGLHYLLSIMPIEDAFRSWKLMWKI